MRWLDFVAAFCAAGGEDHVGAERPVDIVLEVGVEEREGAGEPHEVALRNPQHNRIFPCHHKPGAERGFEQHALAEMLAWTEGALEMLLGLRIVDGELQLAFDNPSINMPGSSTFSPLR